MTMIQLVVITLPSHNCRTTESFLQCMMLVHESENPNIPHGKHRLDSCTMVALSYELDMDDLLYYLN